MPIRIQCANPQCGKTLSAPDDLAGKMVRCPVCGKETTVPISPASRASPVPADQSQQRLGDYALVRKLGQGGMGAVYEAAQIRLDRRVALKVLPENYTSDPGFLERFQREAKAAAALNHPNIVQVYDLGEERGSHFFSMEFVDGESLLDRLKREGKLPLKDALEIIESVAKALHYAHGRSIIHRDIKPDNIMLSKDGQVKLADLGLAKSTKDEVGVTATGVGLGTPYYMAPEQAEDARRADHRADIYALGITLLHLLTGKRPFSGESAFSIIIQHREKPLPSGKELGTELPPNVEAFIRKMAAKKPEQRYPDYYTLLTDIAKVKEGRAIDDQKPLAKSAITKLREAPTVAAPPKLGKATAPRHPARTRPKRKAQALFAIAGVVIIGGAVFVAWRQSLSHSVSPSSSSTTIRPAKEAREVKSGGGTVPIALNQSKHTLTVQFADDFALPAGDKDHYGNPIRKGTDKDTGLPFEISHKVTGMSLVFIPPGEFQADAVENNPNGPKKTVRINEPFYIGKYEVTVSEWNSMKVGEPNNQEGSLPAASISALMRQEFLQKLNDTLVNAQGKVRFAYPWQSQWEYACRAGTTTTHYFGDNPAHGVIDQYAWYTVNANRDYHKVGQKKPNAWELYDMSGSLWEWCEAWDGDYPAPEGMTNGVAQEQRVLRGGSLFDGSQGLMSSSVRMEKKPVSAREALMGLRMVLQLNLESLGIKKPEARPADETQGFKPLFTQNSAAGWVQAGPGGFRLKDGVTTSFGGMGLAWYKAKMFEDFALRLEYMVPEEIGNSGVYVRFPDPGNDPKIAINQGYEIAILKGEGDGTKGEKAVNPTGAVFSFQPPREVPQKAKGEWNAMEITCIGQNYFVRLNGKLINHFVGSRNLKGYIGLQNHPGGPVSFRNVLIEEFVGKSDDRLQALTREEKSLRSAR